MPLNMPIDEDFEFFLHDEGFGPAVDARPVPAATLVKYRGKLPNQWLTYWAQHGWAGYGEGRFWTVDPDEYAPVVEAWLDGTEFIKKDHYYAVARGAFGDLFLWGTRSGQSLKIAAAWGMIFPKDNSVFVLEGRSDDLTRAFFAVKTKEQVEFEDQNEQPLFERALAHLGQLDHDTMYGFEPAIALGGPRKLERLHKVDAVAHLLLLAQLGERRIMADIVQVTRGTKPIDQRPGMRVRSDESCPYPGIWACEEAPLTGPQTFMHGVQMPKIEGQVVTWRLIKTIGEH